MGHYTEKAEVIVNDNRAALQLLWDNINKGQQKQLAKVPEIAALLERYGVEKEAVN